MQTIAEMPEFIRRAEKVLGSGERQALIEHLAESPKAGVLIQGTVRGSVFLREFGELIVSSGHELEDA